MTMYQVWEASLHAPGGTVIATFDTQEEAREYVLVNNEYGLESGYDLFVMPASDK